MNWADFLLLVLTGWTVVGVLGVTLSFLRRERAKAIRHLAWIAGIWLLYIALVVIVSLTTRPRPVARGQEQCMESLCLAVTRTDVIPGYLATHGERVLRVSVRITNRDREERKADTHLKAYLLDSRNRRWDEIPGLEGVQLSTSVAPGNSIISEPVFKVDSDATDLRLVFTHGRRLPYALLIGDRDSLLHPLVTVPLER